MVYVPKGFRAIVMPAPFVDWFRSQNITDEDIRIAIRMYIMDNQEIKRALQ